MTLYVPEEWFAKDPERWAGEYEVQEISAYQRLMANGKAIEDLLEEGVPMENIDQADIEFDISFRKHLIKICVTKDGKPFTDFEMDELPSKLYDVLIVPIYQKNMCSPTEARFLQRPPSMGEKQNIQP